jgi:hypothetical protein
MRFVCLFVLLPLISCSSGSGRSSGTALPAEANTISTGVSIAAFIDTNTKHRQSLLLTLRNSNAFSVNVVTGIVTGTQYPIASFQFRIKLRDGRSFELFCDTCAPAFVAGMVSPYVVNLSRDKAFTYVLPLTTFLYIDGASGGDKRLETEATKGAEVTVSLRAEPPESLHVQTPPRIYWRGKVTTTVRLPE